METGESTCRRRVELLAAMCNKLVSTVTAISPVLAISFTGVLTAKCDPGEGPEKVSNQSIQMIV